MTERVTYTLTKERPERIRLVNWSYEGEPVSAWQELAERLVLDLKYRPGQHVFRQYKWNDGLIVDAFGVSCQLEQLPEGEYYGALVVTPSNVQQGERLVNLYLNVQ